MQVPLVENRSELQAASVGFIPSVSGGLGHVTRTLKLARAIERADPSVRIVYILDQQKLRDFNVRVVESAGYPVRLLRGPLREERTETIVSVLGDLDVVIEDTNRQLIPYRRLLPRLKVWISMPMLPLGDELFLDWPLLEQVDHILYCYPPAVMPLPDELEPFREKLTITGPLLHPSDMPSRAVARARLGISSEDSFVTYAPRGFPFGKPFGQRVLSSLVRALMKLRKSRPGLRLILTGVPDVSVIQPPGLPPLAGLEGITIEDIVSPEKARDYLSGVDLAIVEGSSTLFDAALAKTPVLMIPGPIYETLLIGSWMAEHDAGIVMQAREASASRLTRGMEEGMSPAAAGRAQRLYDLVGQRGRDLALETVLRLIPSPSGT